MKAFYGKSQSIIQLRNILTAGLIFLLIGCTSVKVDDVDASEPLSHVCIESNPKVIVVDFLPVVRDGFTRHGITSEVYDDELPSHCRYRLTYTALKTWDMAMYMHHAELRLYKGQSQIAFADYHLNGGGGLALNKWASVESKMTPVLDEFLAAFTPKYVDTYRKDVDISPTTTSDDNQVKLEILKQWFEEGLIDQDEYESEKKRILASM